MSLRDEVRKYWEENPCGTSSTIVGELPVGSREWFERIEDHRYRMEPFIHGVAQFTRHQGKRVLEVGVGTGTDFLQWARAGTACVGIDVTDAGARLTRMRLHSYGFDAPVLRADAEALPFANESFDGVYSWGVLHHSANPPHAVGEVRRVLRPGGTFLGMLYNRHSLLATKLWVKHALLAARPWRRVADLIWEHVESVGTKAYAIGELPHLFADFRTFAARPFLTPYDTSLLPRWLVSLFPDSWGWFIAITAQR